jgi:hypothetical protein
MDFSDILKEIKNGKQAYRENWNGKGMFITVRNSCEMSGPYIYIKNVRGDLMPWQPSQEDIFACDWIIK